MASVTTLYHLTNKEGSMNKALERISSGLRLNHAVDDAAGASIVNRMTSQIKGIEAAIRNAADAISLTQTAEGSLEEVSQILHRMRELSVQAANGVYTGQDRQAINNEITAMQNELGRIAESSRFNGVKMLNGEFQDTTFQIGFTANDTATLSIEDVRPQGLGEYVMSTSNSDVADVVIGASAATRTYTLGGNAATGSSIARSASFALASNGAQGDTYSITVGPDTITTDAAVDSTTYDSVTKLAAALEAKKPAGAAYSISAGTARVVTLADHGTPAFEAAMNANAAVGDKYVIDVGGTDIEYTLLSGDVTSLQAAADTAARVKYLAGKLDVDANTANAGSDIGFGVTSSGTSFIVTANAVGADATVIGPLRLHPNGGSEADLGAASTSVNGSATDLTVTFSGTGAGGAVAMTADLGDDTGLSLGTFTADASVGVATSTMSKSSASEGNISLTVDKLSGDATTANTFNKIIADNAGGTYTLSGTDASKFTIDAATGTVTATLDYETATDSGTNNVYDIEVNYFKGGVKLVTETVELTVTNRVADDNNTQVSAAAQPKLGTSLANVASGIIEAEDFTIYGNVGTKVIDVNGSSSARDIVASVNGVQGETGVYAEAQTRVNMSFPEQAVATSDSVTFKLYGKNTLPQVISGTVEFGVTNGRDANVRALADAVNGASGATGITAKVSANGSTLSLISNEGYDIVLEGYELTAQSISANVYPADESLVNIGAASVLTEGAANNNSMRVGGVLTFHSPYVFSIATAADGAKGGALFQQTPGAATLSAVSDLNVLTIENAKKMLTAVDGALVRIDLERSDIGATMSRMEHTISNLSNIALNTKGARSRIQDADIAAETVELNRAQVLSQAAQAMLAQANRTSQSILSLLQG
jgi:flagellin